ncbi:hypothetical protein [Saccharopolyspora sp. NPDC002376]
MQSSLNVNFILVVGLIAMALMFDRDQVTIGALTLLGMRLLGPGDPKGRHDGEPKQIDDEG